ncbi:MAG: PAS domain S-box protein [Verrucomicrobia bacterium]|nr:PAS domain S-box protein [Verrucomicrobiota bacterium]
MRTSEPSELRVWLAFLLIFALSAAGFGLLALVGWVLGLPRLTSFGADLMPMAPSTAVLFLLLGAATGLRGRTPLSRRNFWISVAVGCLGALAALLLFVLACLNIHWAIEHVGLNITGMVDGAPVGHMSPVGAFCFLFASVSFLASLSPSAIPRWRVVLASGFAGVLLAICFIFLLAYLYGAPLLYGGTFIPPALNTVLAFTMLGVALLLSAARSSGPRDGQHKDVPVASYVFLLIFVLLATGIVTVGYLYYRHYEKQYRVEEEHQLSAIAELKVDELVQWRKERMTDGAIFLKNPSFSALVRRFFAQPADADAQRQLLDWLGKFPTFHSYNQFRLMDAQGVTRLSVPRDLKPATSDTLRMTAEVLRSGQVALQDFYRHKINHHVYVQVMVPILDELDANKPLGVIELRLDPAIYLYPFIQRWPTPSRTAETLLVRREGNEVVFLNELRFQTNTALNLRMPLDRIGLPAAQAALGREGVVEGVDYRGEPVVAVLRTVPDSSWSLVAKMDAAEMYAPLRTRLWQVVVMIGFLLFGAGTSVGLVWRHQRVRFYKERAQATEVLRESEERFRTIFEEAPLGVALIDSHTGHIYEVNPRFAEIAGRTRVEMATIDWMSITHPDDVQEDLDNMALLNAGKISGFNMNKRYRRLDGSYVWINMTIAPMTVKDKSHPRHLCMIEDITERKRAEEAQRASAVYARSLIEASLDPLVTISAEGKVTDVNEASVQATGVSREKLVGTDFSDYFTEPEKAREGYQRVFSEGFVRDYPLAIRHVSGRVTDVLYNATVYRDAQGQVLGVFAAARDITERKRAEVALQEKNAEMERFLYTASHDLKSPVVTIRTFLGYLEQDTAAGDAGRMEKDLRFIRAATDKMGRLLEELLEISRIGRVVSPPVSITLRKLVDEALGAVAGRIAERGVTVKVGDTDMLLRGDRIRLAEIWQNLVENACKFMGDQKEPRVEIGVEARGAETVFFVRDNGIGIDPRYYAKVFGLFEKLDPKAEGTGLGLALVKRVVELYRGRIWVESLGQGQGACFYFTLPGAVGGAGDRSWETGDRIQKSGDRS